MTRAIKDHICNPVNDKIEVSAIDEPGPGGANHLYQMKYESIAASGAATVMLDHIKFQKGAINEFGVNGVTQEVLLAIVIDRLRSFQAGPFSCRENAVALTKCEEALMWLHKRTRDRMARGVEGQTKA